jgi:hypothetical protein
MLKQELKRFKIIQSLFDMQNKNKTITERRVNNFQKAFKTRRKKLSLFETSKNKTTENFKKKNQNSERCSRLDYMRFSVLFVFLVLVHGFLRGLK